MNNTQDRHSFRLPFLFILCVLYWTILPDAQSAPVNFELQTQTLRYQGSAHTVEIPGGYRLELLTDQLDAPRLLSFDRQGILLIGSKSDRVYRLSPPYNQPETLVELAGYPHSVALRQNHLFIATTDSVYRADYQPGQKTLPAEQLLPIAPLPGGGGHSSRTIATGPDNRIYVSLGIAGNCSDQYLGTGYRFDDRRGGIMVLNETATSMTQGARWETYASGLRNPVGFDWHPKTGMMYAVNNGPDHLGFEQPPEYFSKIKAGSFHGMPWFYYNGREFKRDPCIDSRPPRPVEEVTAPVATFPSRNAPLGMAFVPQGGMDVRFEYDAIIALHGSWATQPRGGFFGDRASRRPPKLVIVRFDKGEVVRVDDLVTGFQLENGERWARPTGVAIGPNGDVYFTSDSGINGLFRLRKISKKRK